MNCKYPPYHSIITNVLYRYPSNMSEEKVGSDDREHVPSGVHVHLAVN